MDLGRHQPNAGQQQQAAYQPGEHAFGKLRQVDELRLSMQLEQDGLRTTARWSLREE